MGLQIDSVEQIRWIGSGDLASVRERRGGMVPACEGIDQGFADAAQHGSFVCRI